MSEQNQPPQQQEPPGETGPMRPPPKDSMADYTGRDHCVHVVEQAVAALRGNKGLIDYSATKGAVHAWTFGAQTPYGRVARPDELAPSYVFFAAEQLSSYYTGQVLAALGGETTPG